MTCSFGLLDARAFGFLRGLSPASISSSSFKASVMPPVRQPGCGPPQERETRVAEALKELEEIEAKCKAAEEPNACASSTDPEARVMKMAGGAFRPAYNVQFATETTLRLVAAWT